ncbi:response regulator [Phragmitibacter flavus]|uniref:Response regulator n=1 Tax=Phragmitibacter flavus TaxID=2576071 RepID=A0A5R8KCX4_9BACT|nr:response regulator [Phragmitibacter flavus]TLD70160.1 response regulator [Phragmitibacter flavus]
MLINPPSICILDDDASVLRSIVHLLESGGFAASSFQHVAEFLAHVHEHEIKLAILDVFLGEENGLVVQTQLRRIAPDTQVIVMTGREQPGMQATAMENGAKAFLLKPFEDEMFLEQVREALSDIG